MIEQLEGDKAPAIGQNYKIMKQHANEISAANVQLKEDANKMLAEKAEFDQKIVMLAKWMNRKEDLLPVTRFRNEAEGMLIAYFGLYYIPQRHTTYAT